MSYFTETFEYLLEKMDIDKEELGNNAMNAGKAVGKAAVTTALTGNPVKGAMAAADEIKFPYEITYIDSDNHEYHGKMAYNRAKSDYIKKKTNGKKLGFKDKMTLNKRVEARLNMALAYERYDLNRVLAMYPDGYDKDEK